MSKKTYKSIKGKSVYVPDRMQNIRFTRMTADGGAIYETEDEAEIKALKNAEDVEEYKGKEKGSMGLKKEDYVKLLKSFGFESGRDYPLTASNGQLHDLYERAQKKEVTPLPADELSKKVDEPSKEKDAPEEKPEEKKETPKKESPTTKKSGK